MRVQALPGTIGSFEHNYGMFNDEVLRGSVTRSGRIRPDTYKPREYTRTRNEKLALEPLRSEGEGGVIVQASSTFELSDTFGYTRSPSLFAPWKSFAQGFGNVDEYGGCWMSNVQSTNGEWLSITFPEAKTISRFTVFRPNTRNIPTESHYFRDILVQGSNDNGETWVTVHSVNIGTTTTPMSLSDVVIPTNTRGAYKTYRFTFSVVSGYVSVGRIRLYELAEDIVRTTYIPNSEKVPMIYGNNHFRIAPLGKSVSPVVTFPTLNRGSDPTTVVGCTPTAFTSTLGITAGQTFTQTHYGHLLSDDFDFRLRCEFSAASNVSRIQTTAYRSTMFSNILFETEHLFFVVTYSLYTGGQTNGSNSHTLSVVRKDNGDQYFVASGRFEVYYLGKSPSNLHMVSIVSTATTVRTNYFTAANSAALPTFSVNIFEFVEADTPAGTTMRAVNGITLLNRFGNSSSIISTASEFMPTYEDGKVVSISYVSGDQTSNVNTATSPVLSLITVNFSEGTHTFQKFPIPVPEEYDVVVTTSSRLNVIAYLKDDVINVLGFKGVGYVLNNIEAPAFKHVIGLDASENVAVLETQLIEHPDNVDLSGITVFDKESEFVWSLSNSTLVGNALLSGSSIDFKEGIIDTYYIPGVWNRCAMFMCGQGKATIGNFVSEGYLTFYELEPELLRDITVHLAFDKRAYSMGENATLTITVSEPVRLVVELDKCQFNDGTDNREVEIEDSMTFDVNVRGLAYASVSYVVPLAEYAVDELIPTEPEDPEPTDPEDPEPTEPEDPEPTEPTEPEDPEPEDPEDPEPTEPEDPEPEDPEDPEQPTNP